MRSRLNILAWAILASVFVGMSIYLILNPTRTGVVPNYRFADSSWWASESMYPGGTHGFLYAPSSAVLFSPFHFLRPALLGEILWRAFGFGLFAFALRNLSVCSLQPAASLSAFRFPNSALLALVLLSVPASLASLNNGQTNLSLSASLVLAVLALRDQKWNLASLLLTLALILKPIALAPWLLAFAVIPNVRKALLVGLSALVVIGFFHPSPMYALGQWGEFFQKLFAAYTPENLRVSDLFGSLEKAGVTVPLLFEKGTRALACLGALAWVWRAYRLQGLSGAAWALWVTTALVFTVFNPRAETNSYVLISPLLAFAAVSYWREMEGGRWKATVLAAACIGLMCDGMGLFIYKATDVWFKPLLVLLVSPLLFRVPEAWKGKT